MSPRLEGTDSRLKDNYQRRKDAIRKCYEVASERGYKFFAVQDGGACFGDESGGKTYMKYGRKTRGCYNGKGGPWGNDVYQIYGNLFAEHIFSGTRFYCWNILVVAYSFDHCLHNIKRELF